MFRIRLLAHDDIPTSRAAIAHVQDILRGQFPALRETDVKKLPDQLRDPIKYRLRSLLFVAEGPRREVRGFALINHAPDLDFCYLDYIASKKGITGAGIGGALYQRVRQEAASLRSVGLFFECLPDDPALSRVPEILKQNIARLRFYEGYGARPITGTLYETPLRPEDDNPPYLVFDPLGSAKRLRAATARAIVRAILERKYGARCPPGYVDKVVASIKDDPVRIRAPRYVHKEPEPVRRESVPADKRIVLVVTDQHAIHHVHDRGYVQSPVRIRSILKELERTDLFRRVAPRHYSERHIRAIHDPALIDYLRKACANLKPGGSIYPYVFPIRNATRPPKELPYRAGYYCIDTFTPINQNAFVAAKRAVDCALTAAGSVVDGARIAYALVRPPGHHAERRAFGGFCYFNSAAIAAHHLSALGKVAILDLDYHHGNGHQDIFYERSDVLTISIHGHPRFAYPFFSGFEEERGTGAGLGANVNFPLPETITPSRYHEVLVQALHRIQRHKPTTLVVALGLDTAKNDPTGTWTLLAKDFLENGAAVGKLGLPTLVVQEGGYDNRVLGRNARHFFAGLWSGAYGQDAASFIAAARSK